MLLTNTLHTPVARQGQPRAPCVAHGEGQLAMTPNHAPHQKPKPSSILNELFHRHLLPFQVRHCLDSSGASTLGKAATPSRHAPSYPRVVWLPPLVATATRRGIRHQIEGSMSHRR